jgi:stachydrine N-demethylase, reductase component
MSVTTPTAVAHTIQALQQIKPWDASSELLECTMVLDDSADVKTFCFQTAQASWFHYAPGQFITIEAQIAGKTHSRCYTLSSSPSRPLCATITVKATGGPVSSWLHQHLKVGDTLRASAPSGIFSFHHHPAHKYSFLAGGVGITPLMSMTRWLFDFGARTDVCFIQCARTPEDLLFRTELEAISGRLPEFRVAWVCEKPKKQGPAWPGYSGRLNQLMLELICPDYMEREVFCCGPTPYMQAVRDILIAAGYDMKRYHEESFTTPVHDESETIEHDDVHLDAERTAHVRFAASGREMKCREADTLLHVAREAGLHLPSACLFGVCGTCKVKKIEGKVHMMQNGGLSDEDVADGWVLACCSRPIGNVVVDC